MQKTIIISAIVIAIGIAVGLMFLGEREPNRDIGSGSTKLRASKTASPSPQVSGGPTASSSRTATHAKQVDNLANKSVRRIKNISWQDVHKGVEAGWIKPVNISKNKGNSASPSLALDEKGTVYVAWHDNSSGNYEILFSRQEAGTAPSEDKRWSKPLNISKSKGISVSPALTVDEEGTIHIVWADKVNEKKDLFYSQSPTGKEWSEAVNISNDRARSSYYPSLAADSKGNLHLVSNDTLEHESDIFYRANIKGAWSKSAAQKISKHEEDSMGSFIPRIAIDSKDNLFVVCHYFAPKGTEIHCIERGVGQKKWSVTNISPESNSRGFNPDIAIDKNDVIHVVWDAKISKKLPSQIFYSRRNGGSWSKPIIISNTPEDATNPSIADDANGDLHVAWKQKVADRNEIFYVHYIPSKNKMSTEGLVNISNSVNNSVSPRISVDGHNNVHVVWSEIVDKQAEIYYSVNKGF